MSKVDDAWRCFSDLLYNHPYWPTTFSKCGCGRAPMRALEYVMAVVHNGRVSESDNGPCFCFVTVFHDDVRVYAERTKTMDTLRVFKRERPANN